MRLITTIYEAKDAFLFDSKRLFIGGFLTVLLSGVSVIGLGFFRFFVAPLIGISLFTLGYKASQSKRFPFKELKKVISVRYVSYLGGTFFIGILFFCVAIFLIILWAIVAIGVSGGNISSLNSTSHIAQSILLAWLGLSAGVLLLLYASTQFITASVVIQGNKAIDAVKQSYTIFTKYPAEVFAYTLLKGIFSIFLIYAPLFIVFTVEQTPLRIGSILGSIVLIPFTKAYLSTFHAIYFDKLRDTSSTNKDTASKTESQSEGVEYDFWDENGPAS